MKCNDVKTHLLITTLIVSVYGSEVDIIYPQFLVFNKFFLLIWVVPVHVYSVCIALNWRITGS